METKAAQATNNTGLLDILEQVHAFSIQNDDFESMKSNKLYNCIDFNFYNTWPVVGDKIVETLYSNRVTLENKIIHTPPLPLAPFKVGVFVVFYR